ncbi:flagellar filament capping protein FliD [Zoogloeaceae bacterium G21618-S1]|nr:flagellar filament capping protein FliD [Zoogloeaceae bacterium G21618-S1]
MATGSISSLGIGSGLNSNDIVSQLMALERRPLTALTQKESSFSAKISALGSVKSKLSELQTASKTLSDPNKLAAFAATVGDSDIISATADTFAKNGSYAIDVVQLAKAQKSFSSIQAGGTTFGAGTLSFSINGNTQDVVLASGGNSLQDVANAINDAGIDVRATVVTGDAGSRLVLTSKETGTDNAFTLSVSGGDPNLTGLATFDGAHPNATTALNSIITIEGETVTSQSNTVTSGISNVTVTAKAIGSSTLDVARDSTGIETAVKAMVDAYNSLRLDIGTKSAYNAETKVGEPLNGDSVTRTLLGRMRDTMGTVPTSIAGSDYQYLFSIGVSFAQDGTLTLDSTKLNNAVATDFDGVVNTLGAYGTAIDTMATAFTQSDGLIDSSVTGIESSISNIDSQRERLERQFDLTEARLRAQFTALDTLVASLNTTSTYLTQQLSSLSNLNQ